MKIIIAAFLLLLKGSCFAQVAIGKLYSIVNGAPISNTTLRIDKKQFIQADSNGVFLISTAKRKIRISVVPETIYHFDTLLLTHSITDTARLFISYPVDSSLATYDIEHNRVQFFCGGSIAPLAITPPDKIFEGRYAVKYHMLDCIMPGFTNLASYNQKVAVYLDKKYGVGWRQTVRPDIFGVTEKGPQD